MFIKFILKKWELLFVSIFILGYFIASISVSLNRFWQYDVFWYDFGIVEQAIWQMSKFQTPYVHHWSVDNPIPLWGDHFNPSVLMLVPLYWITTKPEILFIAQSLFVSVSAIVAYITLFKLNIYPLIRIATIISFLGFIGTQNALITDIHSITFSVLFLTLAISSIYLKQWRMYWLWISLTLGWQENLSTIIFGLGLFLIIRKDRQLKIGLATCMVALIYGIITLKLIIPFFRGVSEYHYVPLSYTNEIKYLTEMFSSSTKLQTIFYSFLTFGVVPAFSFSILPAIFWHWYERFVLNDAPSRWSLGMHYNIILIPFFLAGIIEFWTNNPRFVRMRYIITWSLFTIFTVIVLHRVILDGPLLLAHHPVFYEQTQRAKHFDNFINQIPRNYGLIMTQNHIAVRFTHDQVMLLSEDYENYDIKVIAISLDPEQNPNNFYPLNFDQGKTLVNELLVNPNFTRTNAGKDAWYIFLKK